MSDEFPHCHYCGRLAFEFYFTDISICDNCMQNLSGDRIWRLVRDYLGQIWVTTADNNVDFEVIDQGTFKDMWRLCQQMDDSNV